MVGEAPASEPDGQRAEAGAHPARDNAVAERDVEDTFVDVVDEGRRRLSRPWLPLLATGAVGGIDVGTGVLGLLLVEHATGSPLLGGLAFSIGIVAVTLAAVSCSPRTSSSRCPRSSPGRLSCGSCSACKPGPW